MKRLFVAPLGLLFILTGCVSIPAYDARIDEGLTDINDAVYEHYSSIAQPSDPAVCSRDNSIAFWRSLSRQVALLRYRAALLPQYETLASRLDGLQTLLANYRADELAFIDSAVARTASPCPPEQLAMAYQDRLSTAVGSVHRIALMYEKGGS